MVMVATAGLSGCQSLGDVLSGASKPDARITSVKLTGLDLTAADLQFGVQVVNPYPVPLPLVQLDYAMSSGDSAFLSGSSTEQGVIPANGSSTFAVPARVNFAQLLAAVSGVRPGQVIPYTIDATVGLDLTVLDEKVLEPLRLPLQKSGELPVPAVPGIELSSVDWTNLDLQQAAATLNLQVTNNNQFPIDLSRLNYGLSLGGTEVARADVFEQSWIPAGGDGQLQIPISLSPQSLGVAGFNMLLGSGAAYRLQGNLDASTPYGPISLPFDKSGNTLFRR